MEEINGKMKMDGSFIPFYFYGHGEEEATAMLQRNVNDEFRN